VLRFPTARSTAPATILQHVMATSTGHCTSLGMLHRLMGHVEYMTNSNAAHKTRSRSKATTSTARPAAPRRSPATPCCTLSTTTGRTTPATPSRSRPAPRSSPRETLSPASRRPLRTLVLAVACSPSMTAPLLLLASSTSAALAQSTLSATRAISPVPRTPASCLTSAVSRLLRLTRLRPPLSRLLLVLERSEYCRELDVEIRCAIVTW
jgi:hypothetical protein